MRARGGGGRRPGAGRSVAAERICATVTSAAPATSLPRRIVNPHQGDIATFLQASKESGGERTLAS